MRFEIREDWPKSSLPVVQLIISASDNPKKYNFDFLTRRFQNFTKFSIIIIFVLGHTLKKNFFFFKKASNTCAKNKLKFFRLFSKNIFCVFQKNKEEIR